MDTALNLFKRCVQCPSLSPTCPDCRRNEICSLVPQDCDSCAYMTCIVNPNPAPAEDRTNVGAIAGGVIGGVALVGFVVFLLWRFGIKKRREQQDLDLDLDADEWEEDDIAQQKHGHRFNNMRSDAASTRTKASLAGSFLSRASNIIQIAYIPGVTNRNRSGHDSLLTTPVPPIPAMYADSQKAKSPLRNQDGALFFSPADLRGSTYSGSSSLASGNRDTQYTARPGNNRETVFSITPSLARSSIMSDVYRDDAGADPMPALTVMRGAPRMVSVKSSAASTPSVSSGSSTHTGGGSVNAVMIGQKGSNSPPSSSLRAKATQITVPGNKGRFPVKGTSPAVPSPLVETATESEDEDEEDEHARARKSLINPPTLDALPLIQPLESPFFDATDIGSPSSSSSPQPRPNPYATMASNVRNSGQWPKRTTDRGPGGLSAVMEEKRASETDSVRGESPFGDEHATK